MECASSGMISFCCASREIKGETMSRKILIGLAMVVFASLPMITSASDREDDVSRTRKAAVVFKEIMDTPDKGIPQELLETAKCIAIIPGDKKFAFIFGGSYGRRLATCRRG